MGVQKYGKDFTNKVICDNLDINMDDINISFHNYIEKFKQMNIMTKREEVLKSIRELVVAMDHIASLDNIQLHYLKSNEINDLKQENVSEDDFLEAMLVYTEVAKNLIGDYLDQMYS